MYLNSQELWVLLNYGCLLPSEWRCYYAVRMYIFWDDNAKAHLIFCSLPVWPNCTMHNTVSGTHCRLQIYLSNLFDELLKSDRNLTLCRIPVRFLPDIYLFHQSKHLHFITMTIYLSSSKVSNLILLRYLSKLGLILKVYRK